MEAGTREFHVTGNWAAPNVETVEHKAVAESATEPAPEAQGPGASEAATPTAAAAPASPVAR